VRSSRAGALALAASGGVAGALAARRAAAEAATSAGTADRTGAPGGLTSHARSAAGVRGAAHSAPPSWEPQLLTRLGRWEPARPRSASGRAAAYLWAAPITAVGLLAGASAGTIPRIHEGTLLFSGARGLPARFFARLGYSAFTLGHVIVAARDEPSDPLLVHELIHTRQAERFGLLMAPLYLGLRGIYGYARNPMERAARRAQRRALGVPERT
jgi:hypothetical protein